MAINFKCQIKEIIPSSDSLIPIEINRLQTGLVLPFNVYIKEYGVIKRIFNCGNVFNKVFLEILINKGFDVVYIDKSETKNLEYYLNKKIQKKQPEKNKIVFDDYSFSKEKLFQIDKRLLTPGTEINFSIYNIQNFEFKKIIEASPKKPLILNENISKVEGELLIENKDIELYEEYVRSLNKHIEKATLSDEDKKTLSNILFKENSKVLIKKIFLTPRVGIKILEINEMVDGIIHRIITDQNSIYHLLTLKGYDYYTYTHSVNVGVLSIGLGIQIKMERDRLQKLGLGAILHDIGKTKIPHIILNKQGRLTDLEYKTLRQHVIMGYEILKENTDIPLESHSALLQHHEKISGRGYPYGLRDGEIDILGRITAIADCYDALTTRRPYKAPLTPYLALYIITREKKDYDKNLLIEFIKMLGNVR